MSWQTDFDTGAAGFITASQLLFAFQAIGATMILLWTAWIVVTSYNAWGQGQMKPSQMLFLWARAVLLLMILLFLFIN